MDLILVFVASDFSCHVYYYPKEFLYMTDPPQDISLCQLSDLMPSEMKCLHQESSLYRFYTKLIIFNILGSPQQMIWDLCTSTIGLLRRKVDIRCADSVSYIVLMSSERSNMRVVATKPTCYCYYPWPPAFAQMLQFVVTLVIWLRSSSSNIHLTRWIKQEFMEVGKKWAIADGEAVIFDIKGNVYN